ncbi:MAG: hypothetical protein AAB798_01205 [Patescibacteria group bacterium]
MATTKERINISITKNMRKALAGLAKRDEVPEATKATALLDLALEIEEDSYFAKIAQARDTKGVRWVRDSDKIWR